METWLEWARGPMFGFAITFMILGLLRHVGLTFWEISRAMRRAGDKVVPCGQIARATLKWLLPVGKIKDRLIYSVSTVTFHVAVILVPVFLAGHIALWERSIGLSWAAIPNLLADILTLLALVTAVGLVVQRALARDSRRIARFQDYVIPIVLAVPFASGFLVMHPALNPASFEVMLFLHVVSGNLVLILIPVTKLSHMVLLPGTQLISEVVWHFPPDAGSKVAVALGKENEPV